MIYLALIILAGGTLLFLYARKKGREHQLLAWSRSLSVDEARAEYADRRNRIAVWYAGMASGPVTAGSLGPLGSEDHMRHQRRDIDGLAEEGAWLMDRIRETEGAQTGPAQRVRHKMELMEAARRQALQPSERD